MPFLGIIWERSCEVRTITRPSPTNSPLLSEYLGSKPSGGRSRIMCELVFQKNDVKIVCFSLRQPSTHHMEEKYIHDAAAGVVVYEIRWRYVRAKLTDATCLKKHWALLNTHYSARVACLQLGCLWALMLNSGKLLSNNYYKQVIVMDEPLFCIMQFIPSDP